MVYEHTYEYIKMMHDFRESYPEECKPSYIKITTITMISKFVEKFDKQKLESAFKKFGGQISFQPTGTWEIARNNFVNQMSLSYSDEYSRNKSVKLFSNGSIQVAGCTDIIDCQRMIKQLTYILNQLTFENELTNPDFHVVMINTNFSFNHRIKLIPCINVFSKNPIFTDVEFKPDVHSAIKIKFKPAKDMKRVTVLIFSTGKVIITGAETLKEVVCAYNILNQCIIEHKDLIYHDAGEPIKKDIFGTFNGYPIEELVAFLKKKAAHAGAPTENESITFSGCLSKNKRSVGASYSHKYPATEFFVDA